MDQPLKLRKVTGRTVYWVTTGSAQSKLPQWMRSAAMSDSGTVFIPAAIAGDEKAVFLCAAYDGVEACVNRRHVFLPSRWVSSNYPEIADICAKIERIVQRHLNFTTE